MNQLLILACRVSYGSGVNCNFDYGIDKYGRPIKSRATCSVDDCDKLVASRKLCLAHYKRFLKYGSTDKPVRKSKPRGPQELCQVEGCENPPRCGQRAGLCGMHYHRQYRHGDLTKTAWRSGVSQHVRRYRHVAKPGHPLANRDGRVYVHRLALYEKVGPDPQQCFHCGKRIVWLVPDPVRNDSRLVFTDHLDGDTGNNSPENLVPACFRCNSARGQTARHKALVNEGWWSGNDTVAKQGRKCDG